MTDSNTLTSIIHSLLATLIPEGSKVALFDFPNHSNVGDSAIWLGEKLYLEQTVKANIIAVDDFNLRLRPFPKLPPETLILIHGGGNFGDLYPLHQEHRESLISHYKEHRIIQMPQSIYYQNNARRLQTRAILNRHPDFHLLARDRDSLAQARDLHTGPSYLCPDMAHCLGSLQRPTLSRYDIVCLLRTDKEKVASNFSSLQKVESVLVADWVDEPNTILKRFTKQLGQLHSNYPHWTKPLFKVKKPFYNQLATKRLHRGESILSSGKVVITDRLHAHLLCTLLSIPHVVLDNSYRKICNYRDAWETGGNSCQPAVDLEEAMNIAKKLLV